MVRSITKVLPGFTANWSLDDLAHGKGSLTTYEEIGSKQLQQTYVENMITPAACRSVTGPCRGCVSTSVNGQYVIMCCHASWVGYPWIEVCNGNQIRKSCGFCLWRPNSNGGGEYVPDLSNRG